MSGIMWAGSQESFDIVLHAEKQVAEGIKAGRYSDEADDDRLPPLWRKAGSVGVIDITGSLIDGAAGWMRYYGVSGYDDIAKAAIAAASDPDVKSLLFKVESGGGQVNGVTETAKLLNQISLLKPSMTFSGNCMCSAAYWLGTSIQGEVHTSQTAEIGSIGVLVVHREYSKMLAEDGITTTVMRAGARKALTNPFEALTDDAKAQVQSQLNDVHDIFKAAVAKNRPSMTAEDLAQSTDGRTFLGKRAVQAGLADKVSSLDQALKLLDKHSTKQDTSSNSKGGKKMNIVLTQQQLAAIQAGATPLSLGIVLEGTADEQAKALASATVLGADDASKKAADETATAALAAAADKDKANPATAPPAAAVDMTALLQSQLVTANAELLATKVTLETLRVTTLAQATAHDGLLAIARKAIGKMSVALGGSDAAAQTLDAAAAIAEYAKTEETFLSKFKTGQQSAATPVDKPVAKVDPAFLHAVKNAQTRK